MGKTVGRPTNESIRNKKTCKVILFSLIVIVFFILGYYTGSLINEKENNESSNTQEETKKTFKSKLLISRESHDDRPESAEFEYDGQKYKLNIRDGATSESVPSPTEVLLNDKKVYELFEGLEAIDKIYTFGDLLVIYISSSGVRGHYIEIIDFSGNNIKTINEISHNNLKFYIDPYTDIKIEDNKIMLRMTAIGEGPVLITEDGEELNIPCSSSDKNSYNINDATIVEATFEYEYLGNNKFAESKTTEMVKYKNFIKEYE